MVPLVSSIFPRVVSFSLTLNVANKCSFTLSLALPQKLKLNHVSGVMARPPGMSTYQITYVQHLIHQCGNYREPSKPHYDMSIINI